MKNILLKIFPTLNAESGYYFLLGMFCTMVILFIICFIAIVIWLIIRKNRSVSGISIPSEHGSLFISATAISDLLYSLDDSFPQLEIVRIKLIRDGNELAIQVKVYYSAASEISDFASSTCSMRCAQLIAFVSVSVKLMKYWIGPKIMPT